MADKNFKADKAGEISKKTKPLVLQKFFYRLIHPEKKSHRPLVLILAAFLTLVVFTWLGLIQVFQECISTGKTCDRIKDTKEILFILVGLAPSFLLWAWRNQDKKEELENQQVTNNQANFHKLVEWLGGPDETLQLAAVPQFLSFIKGEKGEEFTIPALETIMARLKIWADSVQCQDAIKFLLSTKLNDDDFVNFQPPEAPLVIRRIHQLFREKGEFFLNRNLTQIQLPFVNLTQSNFSNANLTGANFVGASLLLANFSEAQLFGACFNGANIEHTNFINANLELTRLVKATLTNTNLSGAHLSGANFSNALLVKTNLKNAIYSEYTTWPKGFNSTDPKHGLIYRDEQEE